MKEVKILLTQYAKGIFEDISIELLNSVEQSVYRKVTELKNKFKKVDVFHSALQIAPEYILTAIDYEGSREELEHVIKTIKDREDLLAIQSEIQNTVFQNSANPNYNWAEYKDKIKEKLKQVAQEDDGVKFLNQLSFDEEITPTVCSWGVPLLDYYFDGGIAKGAYVICYANSGVGKTTNVTIPMAANAIKHGKKPIIIVLEGNYDNIMKQIVAHLAGCAKTTPRFYSPEQKKKLIEAAQSIPFQVPIITQNATKKWQLENYIKKYQPDILIYDQITIGSASLDFKDMTVLSKALKDISRETQIPIIALTQAAGSSAGMQELTDPEKIKDEEAKSARIKYAENIYADAEHAIQVMLTKSENKYQRYFTIRKSRDERGNAALGHRILVELTDNGLVDLEVRNGIYTYSKESILQGVSNTEKVSSENTYIKEQLFTKPVKQPDPPKKDQNKGLTKADIKSGHVQLGLMDSGEFIKTEIGLVPFYAPDKAEMFVYEDKTRGEIERLEKVAEDTGIEELKELSELLKTHSKNSYGDNRNPNYFISFDNVKDMPDPIVYQPYYGELK